MSRYHPLLITEVRRETSDAVSILLQVPEDLKDEFRFQAGQFVNVRAVLDGEEIRRSYSICSTPMSGELRIAVKKVVGGRFSTYASDVLKPGDSLEVMPPEGKFTFRHEEEKGNTYVFFAAGSGITPVIGLIKTILQTMPTMNVILFYGNRTPDSIIFREELEGLKNRYLRRFELHHILSGEMQEAPLFNGRIDADKCNSFARVFFQIPAVRRFFICGPEEMIFTLRNTLIEMGVEEKHIAIELFTTPGDKNLSTVHLTHKVALDPKKECRVTVHLDGNTTEFTLAYGGKSILDAASAAGLDVPFSCKGGVCCTCKAKLLDGEVDMDVVYGLEEDEIENGFILTCQSHPRSEKVLVDYDKR